MDKDLLKQIVKQSSPWGKPSINTNIFKAWSISMAVGLYSIGLSKEEILDMLVDSKYGFDRDLLEKSLSFIDDFKTQAQDQKTRRASSKQKDKAEGSSNNP